MQWTFSDALFLLIYDHDITILSSEQTLNEINVVFSLVVCLDEVNDSLRTKT